MKDHVRYQDHNRRSNAGAHKGSKKNQKKREILSKHYLLANQEVMVKEIGGGSLKGEEDVLFTNKNREWPRPNTGKGSKRSDDKPGSHHGSPHSGGAQKNGDKSYLYRQKKWFDGNCHNCRKKGHMAKDCWSKKKTAESNAATSKTENRSDDEWDVVA